MPSDSQQALGFVTKILVPRRRDDVLRRPRLVEFLHQNVDRRLILISAPAGYGKTTLLVDFAHDTNLPVCWYSLDENDGDPATFLRYFIGSIRRRFPSFGEQTERLIQNVTDVSKELKAIAGALVSEMHAAIPEYFVIVLDDYHLLDSSHPVNEFLDLLIHYLPEHCHVVLATRTIPKIVLTRLVARRQASGLGVAELRFNADEIQGLMSRNYNLALPRTRAEELAEESEGWITGILLTTHSMWQGLFQTMIRARESGAPVFDFLATEVFAQQTPELQTFLVESSVLGQMTPALCDRLLGRGDSRELLAQLEEINLFISRTEGEGSWFRYHHLFQEFLQSKLERGNPDRFRALHLAAARTFEEGRDWSDAFQHFLMAGNPYEATRVVLCAAEGMLKSGRWQTVRGWISALPSQAMAAHPEIRIHEATILLQVGEVDQAIEVLNEAGDLLRQIGDVESLAKALNLKSIARRFKGKHQEAIQESEEAIRLLGEGANSIAVQAHRNLGVAYCMKGDHSVGVVQLKRALSIAEEIDDFYNIAGLNHELGTAYMNCGDPELATHHYERAAAYWRRVDNSGYLGHTLNGMGVVQYYLGHYQKALETFEEALAKAREVGYLRVEGYVLASTGDVHRDEQRYQEAQESYESGLRIARSVEESFLVSYCLDAIGMTHLLLGDLGHAEKLIRQALDQAEERQSNYELGLFSASLGVVLCEKGELKRATSVLKQACRHLEQAKVVRDLAHAEFQLARALFLRQQFDESLRYLKSVLERASQLGYDQFLVIDGRRAVALLRFALSKGVDPERIASILSRVGGPRYIAEDEMNRGGDEVAPVPVTSSAELSEVVKGTPHSLELYSLGQTLVFFDERLITSSEWAVEKTKELLFFFVANPNGLRKEQVIEAIWPDLTPGKGDSNFHSTTYRLRRALFQDCLIYENGRYRFDLSCIHYYDVHDFENQLLAAEREQDTEAKMEHLRRAVSLYRGPFQEDVYSDWAEAKKQALEERYLSALAALARLHVGKGEHQASLNLLQRILAKDAFREEVHIEAMRCYEAMGSSSLAIKHYREFADFLKRELGVEPSSKARELYYAMLRSYSPSKPR
ncbi:MAG: tetratricopeptide repeat protein [Chloroflexi bacterium]|nr:tetratricopeptide repeat protein [Chloroflexota bacterium]